MSAVTSGRLAPPTGTGRRRVAQIKDDQTDRLVILLPKKLKRRLKAIARLYDDMEDTHPTITRVVVDILDANIDRYEKAVRKKAAEEGVE